MDADAEAPTPEHPEEVWFSASASPGLPDWLASHRVSLALTTYQAGKLILVGLRGDGRLTVFERTFSRCMGLCPDGEDLWLCTLYQIWRFANVLRPGQEYEGHDRLYVPRQGFCTGDLDAHDLAIGRDGRAIFANTRFNCLATVSVRDSFAPVWRPPFITALAPEDRCHLNGLALVDGVPRFATVAADSDVADGWRPRRRDGGRVLEIPSGRVVASGLSMPHSPRFHRGRLWLHNSGEGDFGSVAAGGGPFEPLAFGPGYLRGLDFVGDFAVMGLSRPRRDGAFDGLVLGDRLAGRGVEAFCGLQVVELGTGRVAHWLRIEGLVSELYDVVALRGAVRPMALGFKSDEIRRLLTIGEPAGIGDGPATPGGPCA
jgi:uncharacterized protein (TIGR03032 family)